MSAFLLSILVFAACFAEARLVSNAFGDDAVLQATAPTLFGWTEKPGSAVVVSVDGGAETYKAASTQTDGFWRATLKPRAASFSEHTIDVTSAESSLSVTLRRVLFGDVFLCGGQSNMASVQLRQSDGGTAELFEVAATGDPLAPSPLLSVECLAHSGQRFLQQEDNGSTLRANGLCLDVVGHVATPAMAPCVEGSSSQQWDVDSVSGRLVSRATGLCLAEHVDLGWYPTLSGPDVELQPCLNAPHQQWSKNGGWLVNAMSKHCLTVAAGVGIGGEDGQPLESTPAALRILRVNPAASDSPRNELESLLTPWTLPSPATLGHAAAFSSVCWWMGRHIARRTHGPVGLVESALGGTYIEAWSSPDALAKCPCAEGNRSWVNLHSVLFNGMIHPLRWMSFRGVAWFQGEDNVDNAVCYRCLQPAMIEDWRAKFGFQFPFAFVQLAARDLDKEALALFRIEQAASLALPGVAMATALDLGDVDSPMGSVHSRVKKPVGRRLALAMRHIALGEQGVQYRGPVPKGVWLSNNNASFQIEYDEATAPVQLVLKSIGCPVDRKYCGSASFEVQAATDGQWHAAKATQVAAWTLVIEPAESKLGPLSGIRYLFAPWPMASVFNAAGLPATPFQIQQ